MCTSARPNVSTLPSCHTTSAVYFTSLLLTSPVVLPTRFTVSASIASGVVDRVAVCLTMHEQLGTTVYITTYGSMMLSTLSVNNLNLRAFSSTSSGDITHVTSFH